MARGRVASQQRGSTRGPESSSLRALRCAALRRLRHSRRRVQAISVHLAFPLDPLNVYRDFGLLAHGMRGRL